MRYGPKPKYDEKIVEALKELENPTAKQIADRVGTSERNVFRRLKAMNITDALTPGRPKEWGKRELEFARYLLDDGASYREVAESTGISRDTLHRRFPRKGLTHSEGGKLGVAKLKYIKAKRVKGSL